MESASQDCQDEKFASLLSELRGRLAAASENITTKIHINSICALKMRKFYIREEDELTSQTIVSIELQNIKCTEEFRMLLCLNSFCEGQMIEDNLAHSYHLLDYIDKILRNDKVAKKMISPRLSELIVQMSVVLEYIFKVSIWAQTPQSYGINMDKDYSCDTDNEFGSWISHLDDCRLPAHLINPARGKLNYPIHKVRTRATVRAMRAAEANLDQFWDFIDTTFERKTGASQLGFIQKSVMEGAKIKRTPPWEESESTTHKSSKNLEDVYIPFSSVVYDKAMQITGGFDKLSVEGKVKTKTKGASEVTMAPTVEDLTASDRGELQRHIHLDERAYRAIKSLFHDASLDDRDLPKANKW